MCHVNRDSLTHCSQGSVAQLVEQRTTSNPKVIIDATWVVGLQLIYVIINAVHD